MSRIVLYVIYASWSPYCHKLLYNGGRYGLSDVYCFQDLATGIICGCHSQVLAREVFCDVEWVRRSPTRTNADHFFAGTTPDHRGRVDEFMADKQ